MAVIERIAARFGFERRAVTVQDLLARSALTGLYADRAAENFAAVAACVSAIASALASAPALIYQRASAGRVEVPDHPVAQLFRNGPNLHQTMPDLLESWISATLLTGNGLIEVEREGAEVAGLKFLPSQWVSYMIAPSGRLIYDVTEGTAVYGQTARTRRLLADDVVHLKDRSDDGILGRSRLSRSADTVTGALQLNEFARSFIGNGAAPAGSISSDQDIGSEKLELLRSQFDQRQSGAANAGRVMILSGGLKFTPFQVSPEDAELLGSRKFAVEEVCRLFQVPPPIVQDYSNNTFTNSAAAGRWFAQFTLGPWARKIESVLSRALFPEGSGLELELDLSAFLRGDPEARWAAHMIAVETGILDPNEVREIEGYNPRPAPTGPVVA